MLRKSIFSTLALACVLAGGFFMSQQPGEAAGNGRVFELRTYYTHPGKLPNLLARFRNHTTKLFEKHGMTNIGYWVPQDAPGKDNTLIYVLSHRSRDAAMASWKAFQEDAEWKKVREESEKGGKIVEKVDRVFMDAVDFSKIK
jgi:hypothetical protein